ncbi:MAG TPA: hypothetical protein VMA36_04200 [Candidatus Limnocylindria bacterium]|nr:hypothetical protein [Candidatus Limnocylindria bacterium]
MATYELIGIVALGVWVSSVATSQTSGYLLTPAQMARSQVAYEISAAPIAVGLGTKCLVRGLDERFTPPSYLVRDIGKRSVPKLAQPDLKMVQQIGKYVRSKTLRFVFLNGRVLVFDAVAGPCTAGAPGYFVLNGACNEYYLPTDDFDAPHAMPGCFFPPRPWIPGDRGVGSPDEWKRQT